MAESNTTLEIVRQLIQLDNDRVKLYQQALMQAVRSELIDLKAIFGQIIRQTAQYAQELGDSIARLDGHTNGREYKGYVYYTWEGNRIAVEGSSSKATLEICEQEGEAVQRAYEMALASPENLDGVIRVLLKRQLEGLKSIQVQIRDYHDAL